VARKTARNGIPIAVKKLSGAHYVVADMDKAVAFYEGALGLKIKFRDKNRRTQFDVNGTAVAPADPSEGAVPPGGGATIVPEVDDLAATRAALERAGAKIESARDMGGHGKFFTVRDPAGNLVQIFARA
jgi:predicted enzyme related to lactoylglutathione lyase